MKYYPLIQDTPTSKLIWRILFIGQPILNKSNTLRVILFDCLKFVKSSFHNIF